MCKKKTCNMSANPTTVPVTNVKAIKRPTQPPPHNSPRNRIIPKSSFTTGIAKSPTRTLMEKMPVDKRTFVRPNLKKEGIRPSKPPPFRKTMKRKSNKLLNRKQTLLGKSLRKSLRKRIQSKRRMNKPPPFVTQRMKRKTM